MLVDNTLIFTPAPQAVTSSLVHSTDNIDLAGVGSGTAVTNIIGNASTLAGDPGVGRWAQQIYITIGTTFTGGTSLTVNLAAAPDNGSGSPGTYTVISATGAIPVANLTSGSVIPLAWNVLFPISLKPRFFELQYSPAGTFGAGTIGFAAVVAGRNDFRSMQQAANNYVVA